MTNVSAATSRQYLVRLGGQVICSVATITTSALAENEFKLLDAQQIRARVIGKDVTDGPHWAMYFRSDGVLIGSEDGDSWHSNWKILNNELCFKLPSTTEQECNEVWMSGTNIRMRAGKDQETFDAKVMTHQGH